MSKSKPRDIKREPIEKQRKPRNLQKQNLRNRNDNVSKRAIRSNIFWPDILRLLNGRLLCNIY